MDTEQRIERLLDQLEDPKATPNDLAIIEEKLRILKAAQR